MADPQIYTVELDGRQYDLQGDHPPSEAEARAAIGTGAAPSDKPKWYEPGGDVLLDHLRMMANPEVVGGLAGLATGGAGTAAAIGIPAMAGAATAVGRDVLNGETSPKGIALDALVHGGLNAIPGVAGKALEIAKPSAQAALSMLSHIPGMRTVAAVGRAAMAGVPAVTDVAPAATNAVAGPSEGEGFLHYLTGTAMVDSTPPQRMILAQQRLYLNEIAKSETARLAGEAAAKAELIKQAAAKVESAAAAKLAATHAYLVNGMRALVGAGSVGVDSTKEEPAR